MNRNKNEYDMAIVVLEDVRAALQSWCDDLGIEVPDKLHPRDVIDKYLRRHFE